MKKYLKPNAKVISLIAEEALTLGEGEGEATSNNFTGDDYE